MTPAELDKLIEEAFQACINQNNFKKIRRLQSMDVRIHDEDHWREDFHSGALVGLSISRRKTLELLRSEENAQTKSGTIITMSPAVTAKWLDNKWKENEK